MCAIKKNIQQSTTLTVFVYLLYGHIHLQPNQYFLVPKYSLRYMFNIVRWQIPEGNRHLNFIVLDNVTKLDFRLIQVLNGLSKRLLSRFYFLHEILHTIKEMDTGFPFSMLCMRLFTYSKYRLFNCSNTLSGRNVTLFDDKYL